MKQKLSNCTLFSFLTKATGPIKKMILLSIFLMGMSTMNMNAQFTLDKFGKGLKLTGKDSTFYIKFGFRFQNLHTSEWTLENDEFSSATDYEGAFLIRRSRFKFDGWAFSPKLKYKFEVGLSNRDHSGGHSAQFRNTANLILDAYAAYNFYENFWIQFGQTKLPGNRERVISSGNLQFVDRSRLNSRFNIDRDMGFQLKHHFNFGNFILREIVAFSQGEGRNITEGHFGGFEYTFRAELLPFGEFQSKGDYVGSAIKKEEKLKASLGLTYDINKNAVRERGNLGDFIINSQGKYVGKDLNTFFADMMIKYQGFSFMGEYAMKKTADGDPQVNEILPNDAVVNIGTFYTGTGLNLQLAYMFPKNYELAVRYTDINPDEGVSNNETHYTLGLSKFIVGHKLKLQTDASLIQLEGKDDNIQWRLQMDVHF